MNAKVFVVENHALVRDVVVEYISRMKDVEVSGSAATAEEALAAIEADPPTIVVVDLSLPGLSGLDFIREATARRPGLACIVLTGHGEPMYRERARDAGARGYVLKDDPAELPRAIEAVLRGCRYEGPERRPNE